MHCTDCGHPAHHHVGGGVCCTVTVTGPPTAPAHAAEDAALHIGRTLHYCPCSAFTGQTELAVT